MSVSRGGNARAAIEAVDNGMGCMKNIKFSYIQDVGHIGNEYYST